MAEFDLFEAENAQTKQDDMSQLLPVVIDVAQQEQSDKRKNVKHSVVFPATFKRPEDPQDDIYQLPPPNEMARSYKFTLDPFEEKAISALHRGESVLVSAHTSAGKTVIAEYAIALCLARNEKVVYTSPIKALSNQKYRDLTETYSEEPDLVNGQKTTIGLMTGDTTVNRNAEVLVMTTEILRNMLHQGAELLREIGCVIFDEVHYMRNAERGLVWEDCLSLLDSRISFVFLSATIPNAPEFAAWIAKVHSKPIHVVYTEFRPVPLEFMLCPVGAQQAFSVYSSDSRVLNTEEIDKAIQALPFHSGHAEMSAGKGKEEKKLTGETVINMLRMLVQKEISPVIVFSFGKSRCEELAVLSSKVANLENLLTPAEQDEVEQLFEAALEELPEEDRKLREIEAAKELLKKGIAVHHSGLLPFVKEITEILFQEGLVKIIFVTETFAMGLNLPARCVIFSDLKKFDGEQSRYVQSGEFIEMAGRSGRRGLDTQGLVITLFEDADDCNSILEIMEGEAEPLNSAYRLNYGTIINMIRTEGVSPEVAISRSFLQFQKDFRMPRCRQELENVLFELEEVKEQFTEAREIEPEIPDSPELFTRYFDLERLIERELAAMQKLMTQDQSLLQVLQPGRIIEIQAESEWLGVGVVVGKTTFSGATYLDVLVPVETKLRLENRGAEPLLEALQHINRDFEPVDEGVEALARDKNFVSEPINKMNEELLNEAVDKLIFEAHTESGSDDMRKDERLRICRAYECREKLSAEELVGNDVLKHALVELMRKSDYLSKSESVRAALEDPSNVSTTSEQNFKPAIVRVGLPNVRKITSKFIKKIPTSFAAYEDRKALLTILDTATQQLLNKQLEAVIEANPQLRGMAIVEELLKNIEEIFPEYQFSNIEGATPELIEEEERVSKLRNLLKDQELAPVAKYVCQFNEEKSAEILPILAMLQRLGSEEKTLMKALDAKQLVLMDELHNMEEVLFHLNYVEKDSLAILPKGELACEINAASELIVTEAIFNGLFSGLTPELFAGIVCSLIGDVSVSEFKSTSEDLDTHLTALKKLVGDIIAVCADHNTLLDQYITKTEDIVNDLAAELAYEWATGATLVEVCEIEKGLFEGNIVRMLRRLVTVLQQLEEATESWGDGAIAKLCAEAVVKVNRGIVKADSLYIVEEEIEE